MFVRGTINAVIHQNNINLRGKMTADVVMMALLLMFLSVLIGQFMTRHKRQRFAVDDFHPDVSDKTAMSL